MNCTGLSPTCGIAEYRSVLAQARGVVGKHCHDVGVTTFTGEVTAGARGVAGLLHPVSGFNERLVAIGVRHRIPNEVTEPWARLAQDQVLRRTRDCGIRQHTHVKYK